MLVKVRADYACGHESRIIASGKVNPRKIRRDLTRIVKRVTSEHNLVVFNCPCGRGATFVEILVDGKIISRAPASHFAKQAGTVFSCLRPEVQ